MMNLRRSLPALLLVCGLCAPVFAQAPAATAQPAPKQAEAPKDKNPEVKPLVVGDDAPALDVAEWVKGEPISGFEKGRVYVVEFWATWCGPCIASMPHLTELQHEYKDKGVRIIGLTSKDSGNTLDKVKTMVAEKGDAKMGYTVAWDNERKTNTAYMTAAGQTGIPCSFVIDGNGKLAYVGHPATLDEPLKQIVAGTWDLNKAREKFLKAKDAEKARTATRGQMNKFGKALREKNYDEAYKTAGELIDGPAKDDEQMLNAIAWAIVDPEAAVETRNFDLALRAAERACKLTDWKDAAILDTYAAALWGKGDKAKAIEWQGKAVELAKGEMKAELQGRLEEYTKNAK